jgi:DNA-binding CsgD family transcriptional regulator
MDVARRVEVPQAAPSSSMKCMIRKLLAETGGTGSPPRDLLPYNIETQKVIFDTEVDGVRCLLVRAEKLATKRIALSPREQEIVRMVAKGYPNKAIASVLEISSWTVGTHLRRIFAKVSVNSRAALVAQLSVINFF